MIERRTLLEDRARTSVWLGSILVPAGELPSCLNRFTRNLVCYNAEVEGFELGLIGSTTGIAFGEKRYFLSTKHQLDHETGQVHPADVSIVAPGSDVCMTTAGFAEISSRSSDDDKYDLCAFDYTPQSGTTPHLRGAFFHLHSDSIWSPAEDVVAFIAAGHAFDDQQFYSKGGNHHHCVVRSITCHSFEQPPDQSLGRVKPYDDIEVDPNGFSGGPIFAMCAAQETVRVKLAGIINRAGRSAIHFIKASDVLALLQATKDHELRAELHE